MTHLIEQLGTAIVAATLVGHLARTDARLETGFPHGRPDERVVQHNVGRVQIAPEVVMGKLLARGDRFKTMG